MAQLDLSPAALLRLVQRLQREFGETSVSNFALDEQLNEATTANVALTQMLKDAQAGQQSLRVHLEQARRDNEELKRQIDPKRGTRFQRARRKAVNGENKARPA